MVGKQESFSLLHMTESIGFTEIYGVDLILCLSKVGIYAYVIYEYKNFFCVAPKNSLTFVTLKALLLLFKSILRNSCNSDLLGSLNFSYFFESLPIFQ